MAVISNEHLRRVACQIMSEPGFSTDGQGLLRAHRRWVELTTGDERLAAERALFCRWLEDLRAEHDRSPLRFAIPDARDPRPRVVAARAEDAGPQPVPEQPRPGSELKFSSESPDWRKHDAPVAADDLPDGHVLPATQRWNAIREQAPVPAVAGVRQDAPRQPARVTVTTISPVQQPSRKIAAYQQMFPELAFRVQTASGPKPLAEFTGADIRYRIGEIRGQRQAWRTANAGDKARIEGRERLNAADRVRIAERDQNIRDGQAEEVRLAAADREVAENGCDVIGELSPETLAACGFRKRVA